MATQHRYLRRLPPHYYQGDAVVHWTMTIDDRKTGWLNDVFHLKFREIQTHTLFRFGVCCPVYCVMPDHFHLLWMGINQHCDQRKAMRYLRRHLNQVLTILKARFQRQAYDHVLRDQELKETALEDVVEYIARNPERWGLVPEDRYMDYPFTQCLVPGYPELDLFDVDFWPRFWRIYSHLKQNGPSS